jgi:hypothetical protein
VLGRDGGLHVSGRFHSQRPGGRHRDYHASVTVLRRPAASLLVAITAALFTMMAACSPAAPTAPTGTASASGSSGTNAEPSLTPVPGGPGGPARSAVASHAPRTTTEVEGFGTISDTLPASFPKLPDQTESEVSSPASGLFVSNLDPGAASKLIAAALRAQGWKVDVGSPLEDGTVVLEATVAPTGCKTEVRFTPASGSILMSVLYGAACPSS